MLPDDSVPEPARRTPRLDPGVFYLVAENHTSIDDDMRQAEMEQAVDIFHPMAGTPIYWEEPTFLSGITLPPEYVAPLPVTMDKLFAAFPEVLAVPDDAVAVRAARTLAGKVDPVPSEQAAVDPERTDLQGLRASFAAACLVFRVLDLAQTLEEESGDDLHGSMAVLYEQLTGDLTLALVDYLTHWQDALHPLARQASGAWGSIIDLLHVVLRCTAAPATEAQLRAAVVTLATVGGDELTPLVKTLASVHGITLPSGASALKLAVTLVNELFLRRTNLFLKGVQRQQSPGILKVGTQQLSLLTGPFSVIDLDLIGLCPITAQVLTEEEFLEIFWPDLPVEESESSSEDSWAELDDILDDLAIQQEQYWLRSQMHDQ